jgi:F-type H+-transporting ATPase subunit b
VRLLAAFGTRGAALTLPFLLFAHSAMAEAEPKQEGMPQLNFANPMTTAQVVWLALIFGLLYLLLSRWGLPKVAEVLEFRAASIGRDLEAARTAKEDADAAIAELTAATRSAHAAAQAEVAGAMDAAHKASLAQAVELNAKLEAQLASAEARIDAARKAALGALKQVATETTQVVIDRLTGTRFDPAMVEAAVGSAMAARRISSAA